MPSSRGASLRWRGGPGATGRTPPARLRLRTANARDLPTLVRHRRRMWEELRDYARADLDRHDIVYRRWVRDLMARRKLVAFVVEDPAGRPVGSGALWLMPSQPRPGPLGRGEVPYILSMYTEPGDRGRGVASRIVREMVRWSKARHYGRVVLHASRFGRPVYTRLGFEDGSEMRLKLVAEAPLARGNRPPEPPGEGEAPPGGVRSSSGSSPGSSRSAGSGPSR